MTSTRIESEPVFATESPDQPTHPTSLGSTMALAIGKEADVTQALFSEEANTKRDTEEAAHEAARRRASGPYLTPEDVKITWFAQPHPAPWMRWVLMTPEIASYLLREHNDDNRPLRPGRIEYYKKIMAKNKWRLTHQGIAMDSRAVLQDGQHRLAAIVDAGKEVPGLKVPLAFFVGMDPENFQAIDENLNRSPMDLFAKGGIKYGPTITTLIRLALAYQQDEPRKLLRVKLPNETILDYFKTGNTSLLEEGAKFGVANWKKTKSTPGPLAAAYYLLRTANDVDNEPNAYVQAFLDGLVTGLKSGTRIVLDDDDPRRVLRNHFERLKDEGKKFTPLDIVNVVIISWNNVVTGRSPRFFKYDDTASAPRILRCADRGPDRSACPTPLLGEIVMVDGE